MSARSLLLLLSSFRDVHPPDLRTHARFTAAGAPAPAPPPMPAPSMFSAPKSKMNMKKAAKEYFAPS